MLKCFYANRFIENFCRKYDCFWWCFVRLLFEEHKYYLYQTFHVCFDTKTSNSFPLPSLRLSTFKQNQVFIDVSTNTIRSRQRTAHKLDFQCLEGYLFGENIDTLKTTFVDMQNKIFEEKILLHGSCCISMSRYKIFYLFTIKH